MRDYFDSFPTYQCNVEHIVEDICDIIKTFKKISKKSVNHAKNVCKSQNSKKLFFTMAPTLVGPR